MRDEFDLEDERGHEQPFDLHPRRRRDPRPAKRFTDVLLGDEGIEVDPILAHVNQIQAVDVTDVEPTGNPLKDVNVTRPDTVEPCLTHDEALAQAPKAVEGRFAVPRILGEAE